MGTQNKTKYTIELCNVQIILSSSFEELENTPTEISQWQLIKLYKLYKLHFSKGQAMTRIEKYFFL